MSDDTRDVLRDAVNMSKRQRVKVFYTDPEFDHDTKVAISEAAGDWNWSISLKSGAMTGAPTQQQDENADPDEVKARPIRDEQGEVVDWQTEDEHLRQLHEEGRIEEAISHKMGTLDPPQDAPKVDADDPMIQAAQSVRDELDLGGDAA